MGNIADELLCEEALNAENYSYDYEDGEDYLCSLYETYNEVAR